MPSYRLIRRSYILGVESEDGPGSLTNCVQRDGQTQLIWSGSCETQPNGKFFAEAGVEIYEDSGHEMGYEPGAGNIGDEEYSYCLERQEGGRWIYCDTIQSPENRVEPSSPWWEDPEELASWLEDYDTEDSPPPWYEDPEFVAEMEREAVEYYAANRP